MMSDECNCKKPTEKSDCHPYSLIEEMTVTAQTMCRRIESIRERKQKAAGFKDEESKGKKQTAGKKNKHKLPQPSFAVVMLACKISKPP